MSAANGGGGDNKATEFAKRQFKQEAKLQGARPTIMQKANDAFLESLREKLREKLGIKANTDGEVKQTAVKPEQLITFAKDMNKRSVGRNSKLNDAVLNATYPEKEEDSDVSFENPLLPEDKKHKM